LTEKILNEIKKIYKITKNLHDPNLTKIKHLEDHITHLYLILMKYHNMQSEGAEPIREEGAAIKEIARMGNEMHGLLNTINKL